MKTTSKILSLGEYKVLFVKNVIEQIRTTYYVDDVALKGIENKFTQMMNSDTSYVLHFDSNYWADFIANAAGLENKEIAFV